MCNWGHVITINWFSSPWNYRTFPTTSVWIEGRVIINRVNSITFVTFKKYYYFLCAKKIHITHTTIFVVCRNTKKHFEVLKTTMIKSLNEFFLYHLLFMVIFDYGQVIFCFCLYKFSRVWKSYRVKIPNNKHAIINHHLIWLRKPFH